MKATLPNPFSKNVFLASGGKPSTDLGSDFDVLTFTGDIGTSEADSGILTADLTSSSHHFYFTSFMGRDFSFLVGFFLFFFFFFFT